MTSTITMRKPKWEDLFQKNTGTKESSPPSPRKTSSTVSSSEFDLSPTCVASSDFSVSPERYSKNTEWDTSQAAPVAPALAQEETYGYEDATPDNAAIYDYGDASPDASNNKYGYGDARPDSPISNSSLDRKTPRRSSMKQSGRSSRRASIQIGAEIEVNLPGRAKPVRRRTSISFNESVKVKNVEPVSSLTENPEKLWFQDEEYDRIKEKSFDLVDKVECGMTGGRKYCTRGLEKMTTKRSKDLLQQKYDVWDAVINEQDFQRDQGMFDDEYMANLVQFQTFKNQKEATERATQDVAEIENYLRSTRKFCRRLSM